MAHEVIMPMLGMAQDTGKLLTWLKNPGDAVASGDVLFEVETDKSVSEVEAQADGFLTNVTAEAGDDVPVGQRIAVISETAEDSASQPLASETTPEAATETAPEPPTPVTKPAPTRTTQQASEGRVLASPKARRLADEAGLDLSKLAAAGHPQPYHVADLEKLNALPAAHQALGGTSHISAAVPAAGFDAFTQQMQDDGGVALTLSHVVLAFAATGLRKATQAAALTLSIQDADAGRLVFSDPDRLRLSAVAGNGIASDVPSHMELRDAGAGFLTTIAMGQVSQPTLTIARTVDAFHLTLSYASEHFTPDQAIETMHELTARLAEPMLALV